MKVTKESNNKEDTKFVGAGPVSAHTSKDRQNRGITLIALIITIIVMLILVAVTINMAVNGGLFEKAGKAVGETQNAVNQEKEITNGSIQIDGVWYKSIDGYISGVGEGIDWEAMLADAISNPDKYKHKDQSSTNGDIGIGTDGKPVNLDLWTYTTINENEIQIGGFAGCNYIPGYQNSNVKDGKIIGTVPQYIKINGNNEFYPITRMYGTFYKCTSLTTAPTIPPSVTDTNSTFYNCTSLTTAPEIPAGVTDMGCTFYNCTSLTTAPEIPAGVTDMGSTFHYCTSLTTAPEIPAGVTDMGYTFTACTSLTTVQEIPSSVTDMDHTFYGCTKLQGTIEINANPTSYDYCFFSAATEGPGLVVTGSSTKLDTLIATKSSSSNITKGT